MIPPNRIWQGYLTMNNIVIVGAGKIGSTIAGMLASTGDYRVTLMTRYVEEPEQGLISKALATRQVTVSAGNAAKVDFDKD